MIEARTEVLLTAWRDAERAFSATDIGTPERAAAQRRCEEAAAAYKAHIDVVKDGGYLPPWTESEGTEPTP